MKSAPFVRHEFNYDMNEASTASGITFKDKSLTKQSFTEEADINEIVRRFNLTGQLPSNIHVPHYGDYDGVMDFHSAMTAIRQAQEGFDALPAHIRSRFANDPQQLLEFIADDNNHEEAIRLGLIPSKEAAPGQDAGSASSAAPAATTPAAASPTPSAATQHK